jgi:hypothetical protein
MRSSARARISRWIFSTSILVPRSLSRGDERTLAEGFTSESSAILSAP